MSIAPKCVFSRIIHAILLSSLIISQTCRICRSAPGASFALYATAFEGSKFNLLIKNVIMAFIWLVFALILAFFSRLLNIGKFRLPQPKGCVKNDLLSAMPFFVLCAMHKTSLPFCTPRFFVSARRGTGMALCSDFRSSGALRGAGQPGECLPSAMETRLKRDTLYHGRGGEHHGSSAHVPCAERAQVFIDTGAARVL